MLNANTFHRRDTEDYNTASPRLCGENLKRKLIALPHRKVIPIT